jgi:hypothetical protein
MPQRSRSIGNVKISVRVDFDKVRQVLATRRLEEKYGEITTERIETELKRLDSYYSNGHDSQQENQVDLDLLAELRAAYNEMFARRYPDEVIQSRVINLELFILKRCIATAPWPVTKLILNRLEDLFVSLARSGFKTSNGEPNAKLEEIGKLVKRKKIQIPWSAFPIMETFMVSSDELMERYISNAVNDFGHGFEFR